VLPVLVYGDPPQARVDGGKLVHLAGDVPVRDEAAERRLLARLRDELDLTPGRRVEFEGIEAARFAAKLKRFGGAEGLARRGGFDRARIELAGGRFDLLFESADGAHDARPARASAEAVLAAWRAGLAVIPLLGGGWAELPAEWLDRYGHHVADLLASRD